MEQTIIVRTYPMMPNNLKHFKDLRFSRSFDPPKDAVEILPTRTKMSVSSVKPVKVGQIVIVFLLWYVVAGNIVCITDPLIIDFRM